MARNSSQKPLDFRSRNMITQFAPGSLIKARDREWVVLPGTTPELVIARPASGRAEETSGFLTAIETVVTASFSPPTAEGPGDDFAGSLLRDALVLGFRSAAGPLRSFADIAVEPRAYQLVPLLLALRLDPVRLLIADDVGVGKTIEAGLIIKELLARGEISRFCVLCPPVVAQQWQSELLTKFHIDAELVLPSTASRLEKQKDPGKNLFEHFPYTIVSNDFIKADQRRDFFLQHAPELVIIDEAHGCANPTTQHGRQTAKHQRHLLAKKLAQNKDRHLILVTATPHSGDEGAFRSLLCLLDPSFVDLPEDLGGEENRRHRERLARHFIQRRRLDIKRLFGEETPFPIRKESEAPWQLSLQGKHLLASVQEVLRSQQARVSGGKMNWFAALSLLRSLASSPEQAATALEHLANPTHPDNPAMDAKTEESLAEEIFDLSEEGDDTFFPNDPTEIGPGIRAQYAALALQARDHSGPDQDPKLATLIKVLKILVKDGFHPIVFCHFLATAKYVAQHLTVAFPKATIEAVTGQVAPELRKEKVETLRKAPLRILVATDCLSEGINLQYGFNAVVHYDLSWNPTKHEQREGRVDRFGQKAPEVRTLTLYGSDHPVDRRVMEVLLSKEIRIRKNTGVSCPVPGGHRILEWFIEADLWGTNPGSKTQGFLFSPAELDKDLNLQWEDAASRQNRTRTIYSQETARIDDLKAEATASRAATGGIDIVKRFTKGAFLSLGFTLDTRNCDLWKLRAKGVPLSLREELNLPFQDETSLAFDEHPDADVVLSRTHPTLHSLARHMVDGALATPPSGPARRTSVVTTKSVTTLTTLLLVRMRFEIQAFSDASAQHLLAEEACLIPFEGIPEEAKWIDLSASESLLAARASQNTPEEKKRTFLELILAGLPLLATHLNKVFEERGRSLEVAHGRIREVAPRPGSRRAPKPKVSPKLPPDILGVYVYIPQTP